MCLAIPAKVKKIEGQWAEVQSQHHRHRANLSLLKDVKLGDYLLVHDDLAINKVPKKEAQKILKMVTDFDNSEYGHNHNHNHLSHSH